MREPKLKWSERKDEFTYIKMCFVNLFFFFCLFVDGISCRLTILNNFGIYGRNNSCVIWNNRKWWEILKNHKISHEYQFRFKEFSVRHRNSFCFSWFLDCFRLFQRLASRAGNGKSFYINLSCINKNPLMVAIHLQIKNFTKIVGCFMVLLHY